MGQLSFPITSDGLVVDTLVNVEASILVPLRLAGAGAPPIAGRGLIDTASDITAVALPILQQLRTPVVGHTSTQGIGGPLHVNLYRVSLHILDSQNLGLPWLSEPSLLVMELRPGIPFDVLVGMDVLATCNTLIEGPARKFALGF